MSISELFEERSKLRAEHNFRNTEIKKLSDANSLTLRRIRELTYKIQDLQELPPMHEPFNLNDAKGKK